MARDIIAITHLDHNGRTNLWSKSLEATLKMASLALCAVTWIVILAWVNTFHGMLESSMEWAAWPIAFGLGAGLGMINFAIEWGIFTADLRRHRWVWGVMVIRIAVSMGLAMISSKPLQHFLFNRDIVAYIDAEDSMKRVAIKDAAKAGEEKKAAADLKRIEDDRDAAIIQLGGVQDPQIASLIAQNEKNVALYERQVTDARDKHAKEMAGESKDGAKGCGLACQASERALKNAEANLEKARHEASDNEQAARGKLNGDNATEASKAEAAKKAVIAHRDTAITWIENQTDACKITTKYGGLGYCVMSRGYLHKDEVLKAMANGSGAENDTGSESVREGMTACIAFMFFLDLLLAIIKITAGGKLATYNSQTAHAINDPDGDDAKALIADGHAKADFPILATPLGIREGTLVKFEKARSDLAEALSEFQTHVRHQAMNQSNGLHLPEVTVRQELFGFYQTRVMPMFKVFSDRDSELCRKGHSALTVWPSKFMGHDDPRLPTSRQPWEISTSDFKSYGWVDPADKIHIARLAIERLNSLYRDLADKIEGEHRNTRMIVRGRPDLEEQEVKDKTYLRWGTNIRPLLLRINDAKREIREGGLTVPPSPPEIPSDREIDRLWEVDTSTLRRHGWTGPQHTPVSVPAVPATVTQTSIAPASTTP